MLGHGVGARGTALSGSALGTGGEGAAVGTYSALL